MAQRCQTSDVGTVKTQRRDEMFWDAQPAEKIDQWDCVQLIHNQCDCEWWARQVNKQIRFKRTANHFAVTQRKLNTARITFWRPCLTEHVYIWWKSVLTVNRALYLLAAIVWLTGWYSLIFSVWVAEKNMIIMHLQVQTFAMWSYWQAIHTNQLYNY